MRYVSTFKQLMKAKTERGRTGLTGLHSHLPLFVDRVQGYCALHPLNQTGSPADGNDGVIARPEVAVEALPIAPQLLVDDGQELHDSLVQMLTHDQDELG